MNKLYSTMIIIALLMEMPLTLAEEPGQLQTVNGTLGPGTTTRDLGPANQTFVDAAERYIKQKLGEDYYNKFVTFQYGSSHEDCIESKCTIRNEISFNHNILFETYSGSPPISVGTIFVVVDNNGSVANYIGPAKPYQFLVSKEKAIEKAKDYGIANITVALVVHTPNTSPYGYEIVWAVSSNDLAGYGNVLNEPIYKGVYVDVDTGEIRGEYRINPLILTSSGKGGARLGEFFEKQLDTRILFVAIVVLSAVIAFILHKVYRK